MKTDRNPQTETKKNVAPVLPEMVRSLAQGEDMIHIILIWLCFSFFCF